MGFTLVDSVYVPLSCDRDGGLHSAVLGLNFHVGNVGLGLYDPVAGAWLQTPAESAEARAEQETERAESAEARAEQETERAKTAEARAEIAEAETAQLREQLERLQTRR